MIALRLLNSVRVRLAAGERRAELFRRQGARIGVRTSIQITSLGSEPYLVEIGDDTVISRDVLIITHDGATWVIRDCHQRANRFAPVRIGNRCFIGAGSILLPGTSVGDRTVVGAGSVVTGRVPSGVIVAGVPARVISTVDEYAKKVVSESLKTTYTNSAEKRAELTRLLMDCEEVR